MVASVLPNPVGIRAIEGQELHVARRSWNGYGALLVASLKNSEYERIGISDYRSSERQKCVAAFISQENIATEIGFPSARNSSQRIRLLAQ